MKELLRLVTSPKGVKSLGMLLKVTVEWIWREGDLGMLTGKLPGVSGLTESLIRLARRTRMVTCLENWDKKG